MASSSETLPAGTRSAIVLDPFAYFPTRRSRIGGLGGAENSEPSYAFHTTYQPCLPGTITFTLKVQDLMATTGTLMLRVHAVSADLRSEVKLAKTAQLPLATLAERGGEVSVNLVAKRGITYAFIGLIHDETDARASAMTVVLDRQDHGDTAAETMAEAGQSSFGVETKASSLLISLRAPRLLDPVSQMRTARQLDEPDADRVARLLGIAADADAWPQLYVYRVLECYGMLAPGAAGLRIRSGDETLAAAVAKAGPSLQSLDPAILAEPDVPNAAKGRDFLFSTDACDALPDAASVRQFVTRTLALLDTGGVAVHVMRTQRIADAVPAEGEARAVVTRTDIERLAFTLIAAGHEVAQLRYGSMTGPHAAIPAPFGLLVRKALR